MRGKAVQFWKSFLCLGITPAYAGKSGMSFMFAIREEDHPRLCGEKALNGFSLTYLLGSPPPMRGKGQAVLNFLRRARITPAYAGKSRVSVQYEMYHRDHPRLCGEKP